MHAESRLLRLRDVERVLMRNCAVRGGLCRLRFELWERATDDDSDTSNSASSSSSSSSSTGEQLLYRSEATATATASPDWRSIEYDDAGAGRAGAYRARAVAVRVFAATARAGGWERVAERVVVLARTERVAAAAELDALYARQPFALLLVGHGAVFVPAEEKSTVFAAPSPVPAPAPAHTPAHSPSPSSSSSSPAAHSDGAWPAAAPEARGTGGGGSGGGGAQPRRVRQCSYTAETLVQLLCAEEALAAQETATAAARAALGRELAGADAVREARVRDGLRARVAHLEQELAAQQAALRADADALAQAQADVGARGAELLVHERRLVAAAERLAAADAVRARCVAEGRRVAAFVTQVQWRLVNSLQLAYPIVQTCPAHRGGNIGGNGAGSSGGPELPFINALDAPEQASPTKKGASASAVARSEARGLNEEDLLTGMSSTISDFSSFTDALADADALSRSFLNREPPYAICGIELDEDFFAGEEQDLAAALGHCCHLLVLISAFLDVCVSLSLILVVVISRCLARQQTPLTYRVFPLGTESFIEDWRPLQTPVMFVPPFLPPAHLSLSSSSSLWHVCVVCVNVQQDAAVHAGRRGEHVRAGCGPSAPQHRAAPARHRAGRRRRAPTVQLQAHSIQHQPDLRVLGRVLLAGVAEEHPGRAPVTSSPSPSPSSRHLWTAAAQAME